MKTKNFLFLVDFFFFFHHFLYDGWVENFFVSPTFTMTDEVKKKLSTLVFIKNWITIFEKSMYRLVMKVLKSGAAWVYASFYVSPVVSLPLGFEITALRVPLSLSP